LRELRVTLRNLRATFIWTAVRKLYMLRNNTFRRVFAVCFIPAVLALSAFAQQPSAPTTASPSATRGTSSEPREEAPLVVWNRTIFVYRSWYQQNSPVARAARARERIEALPERGPWRIEAKDAESGGYVGILISVNDVPILAALTTDVDEESGETLRQAADRAVIQLQAVLEAREAQRSVPLLMRSIGLSVVATLILLLILYATFRVRGLVVRLMRERTLSRGTRVAGIDLRNQIEGLTRAVVHFVFWVGWVLLGYIWLVFVLKRFPYSLPWGERLGAYLIRVVSGFVLGIIQAAPDLFTIFLIFLFAKGVIRLINSFVDQVQEGSVNVGWLHHETIPATRRLLIVMVWVFALTVAYPYVPGSSTDAFKGISVFIGLVVSLGSAGLVNQVMSGLVVVYSRAFQKGDWVRIEEKEGLVTEVGMLSTKIVTKRREEITIPNSVLVSTTSTNYSRLAGSDGSIVGATVGIGYDAPWRQVHALLLMAAARSDRAKKEPKPRVVQRTLADHFVEYTLLFHIERAEERLFALSDVNAHILDAFNEYGVQIMSPAFEMQPEARVVVPKSEWFAAPASPGQNSVARTEEGKTDSPDSQDN
jgi:small-conductance mechanosensitive channel